MDFRKYLMNFCLPKIKTSLLKYFTVDPIRGTTTENRTIGMATGRILRYPYPIPGNFYVPESAPLTEWVEP